MIKARRRILLTYSICLHWHANGYP